MRVDPFKDLRLRLFVPHKYNSDRTTGHIWPLALAVGADEIYGSWGTESELIHEVRQLYYADCIILCSKVSGYLSKYGRVDPDTQCKLASRTTDDETSQKIIAAINRSRNSPPPYVMFDNWQLRTMVKAALLYGSGDKKAALTADGQMARFGRCLLLINDLRPSQKASRAMPREPTDRLADLKGILIRQISEGIIENPLNLLARYIDLNFYVPKDPSIRGSKDAIDIAVVFRDATGVDLRLFLALGFGLLAKLITVEDFSTPKYVTIRSKIFRKTAVEPTMVKRLFEILGTDRRIYKSEYRRKHRSGLGPYFDMVSLRQKPFIKIRRGAYFPVTPQDVIGRISEGTYWDIHDHLEGPDRERFTRFFGQTIECYVRRAFQRMFPASQGLIQRAFFDEPYGSSNRRRRSSDVILFDAECAVFLDVTVGRLRMEDTVITGNLENFYTDIKTKVIKKAKEIDRVIKDFKSGELELPGWNPQAIKRYFPVVVTVSPLPLFNQLYEDVRVRIRDSGWLSQTGIAAAEIWSLEDVESIEPLTYSGHSLSSILLNKSNDIQYSALPMVFYLAGKICPDGIPNNEYLKKVFNQEFEHLRKELFPREVA